MRSTLFVLCSLLLASVGHAQNCSAPKIRRALILGFDGATGNQFHYGALYAGKMPSIKRLMLDGKFTPCVDETHPSYGGHKDPRCARAHSGPKAGIGFQWLTGPGWLSVLTGVDNDRHRVKDNETRNLIEYAWTSKQWPTFLMSLKQKGFNTAASGVATFLTSTGSGSKPGILDYECGFVPQTFWPKVNPQDQSSCNLTHRQAQDNDSAEKDQRVASFLMKQIQDSQTRVMMGVFDGIDAAGHSNGYYSNENYLNSFSVVDGLVAPLLQEVRRRSQQENEAWLVLVTADHGGHRLFFWGAHDVREGEDDAIPFVVATYGTCDRLQELRYPVTHMDVHPTVMTWFGENSRNLDGRVQGIKQNLSQ